MSVGLARHQRRVRASVVLATGRFGLEMKQLQCAIVRDIVAG